MSLTKAHIINAIADQIGYPKNRSTLPPDTIAPSFLEIRMDRAEFIALVSRHYSSS